jgi:hypothetical protein
MLGDPLAVYLAEVERYASLPWPERDHLLVPARVGDEAAGAGKHDPLRFGLRATRGEQPGCARFGTLS